MEPLGTAGFRHVWVATMAKGVSWSHEHVAASPSLMTGHRVHAEGTDHGQLPLYPTPLPVESQPAPCAWSGHLHGPRVHSPPAWGVSGAARELSLLVH